jgi:chemotaxis signal transduction protein
VSLYLQAVVGAGRYLIEAARIVEVRPVADPDAAERWQGEAVPGVDLRALFGEDHTATGCCILFTQTSGAPAALLVDAVEGLVELGDRELRPLPPIGPLGELIDAVSTKLAQDRPMLRLRGERALAMIAERDISARTDRG